MDDDLFTYEVEVANIPCDSKMDDDRQHEGNDDMGYDCLIEDDKIELTDEECISRIFKTILFKSSPELNLLRIIGGIQDYAAYRMIGSRMEQGMYHGVDDEAMDLTHGVPKQGGLRTTLRNKGFEQDNSNEEGTNRVRQRILTKDSDERIEQEIEQEDRTKGSNKRIEQEIEQDNRTRVSRPTTSLDISNSRTHATSYDGPLLLNQLRRLQGNNGNPVESGYAPGETLDYDAETEIA
ncbi:hypothetical protein Tco_0639970 [Tanacetum coccineum]